MLRDADHLVPDWLSPLLVCPDCRNDLAYRGGDLGCAGCDATFAQTDARVIRLLPESFLAADRSRWRERQEEMVRGYEGLLADRQHSILAYESDYRPLAPLLERYAGRIVDLGGGNGIARHWLPRSAEYAVLDPGVEWLDQPWHRLADVFPCLGTPPPFVRGVAERLPFAGGGFDGALMLWSLNHVARPAAALGEAARVLRPGGRLLVVLEEVLPTWGDLVFGRVATGRYPSQPRSERPRLALRKLRALVAGWPRSPDHLRIREAQLRGRHRFTVVRRAWIGAYLVYELEKEAGSP